MSKARDIADGISGGFAQKTLADDKVLDAETYYRLGDESSINSDITIEVPTDSLLEVSIYDALKSL